MKKHLLFVVLASCLCLSTFAAPTMRDIFEMPEGTPPPILAPSATSLATAVKKLDQIHAAALKKHNLTPPPLCSDAVFLRRVTLDTIGTIPTPREVRNFIADTRRDKRSRAIDALLARDEFVDYAALRWADVLRVKAEFPINLWPHGAAMYYRWIHTAMRDAMPLDQFARELLTASGSGFRCGAVNFYRAVPQRDAETLAEHVALTWLGTRVAALTPDERSHLATFFSRIGYKETAEWKEEIVFWTRTPLDSSEVVFPDGTRGTVAANEDPRGVFAAWLTSRDNTAFREVMANRLWAWLFGQGLVQEPDDFRQDNPPAIPELLSFLGEELAKKEFSTRHLLRVILNSQTYQRSSIPSTNSSISKEGSEEDIVRLFAAYPVRRLEAEVLQDVLVSIFDVAISYTSEVPEPFTVIPPRYRTITLADASVTSPFLDMFGRPSRDTGMVADRNNAITESQMLFMMNSTDVNSWIARLVLRWRGKATSKPREVLDEIWLTLLSRYPSDEEALVISVEFRRRERERDPQRLQDIIWTLLNTREFLCQH